MFTTDACALPLDLMLGGTCVFGMAGALALSAILLVVTVGLLPFSPYRLKDLLHTPENGGGMAAATGNGEAAAEQARQPVSVPGENDDFDKDFGQIGRTVRVLIAVAAADGELDEAEVEVIQAVATGFFGYDISDHQIRRMFAQRGNKVKSLHRLAVGNVVLDSTLAPGECRALTEAEVRSIAD